MATQDYAASIQGVSIRVTRLDAAGNLLNGPGDSYVTSAFMRLSFTPEYEEGDEITEKSANGTVCVTYKSPDTLKRITMELAICEPDPELTNLVSGGLLLRKNLGSFASPNNQSIGWAAPGVGDDPAGYGVSIEAWSWAVKDGKKAGSLPYFYWVFPYVKLRQSGDRVLENGLLANTFEGYGLGNANFGSAPDGRWEFPTAAERPYSYARASYAPTGLKGFYTWNYVNETNPETTTYNEVTNLDGISAKLSSAVLATNTVTLTTTAAHNIVAGQNVTVTGVDPVLTVTNKAKASGTVTLTTASVHNLAVGDTVVVAMGDVNFDGTVVVQTAPSTTTFTYKLAANTVTSVAATGNVTRKLFNGTFLAATASGSSVTYSLSSPITGITATGAAGTQTYTTPTAHGFVTGQIIGITGFTGADATLFNIGATAANNITVTGTTTFTVAAAGLTANVGGTGTATILRDTADTVNSGSTPAISTGAVVTADAATTSGQTGYNVPGNISFNPDVAIDRVIKSNEDPTA